MDCPMDVLTAVVLHLNDSNNAIICACVLAASHTVEEDKVRKLKGAISGMGHWIYP